jgi:DNA/RNA-binding domain of Phe-tRNA-synthetase-like protein
MFFGWKNVNSRHTPCHSGSEVVQFYVNFDSRVSNQFPELAVCLGVVTNANVERSNEQIECLKKTAYEKISAEHNIETLKDNSTVRAYRDLYWKLDVDPTKTRPSGEALLRRVLHGDRLPSISTAVDAYNLASMKAIIPISGFDGDLLSPPFRIRFAGNGETFVGIGMNKIALLTNKTIVSADEKQVLSVYPYRDSDRTKITMQTRNMVVVSYGAPGIKERQLVDAVEMTLAHITQVSGGETDMIKVFRATPE